MATAGSDTAVCRLRNVLACLFVCLFVCLLLACLLICLFVCCHCFVWLFVCSFLCSFVVLVCLFALFGLYFLLCDGLLRKCLLCVLFAYLVLLILFVIYKFCLISFLEFIVVYFKFVF